MSRMQPHPTTAVRNSCLCQLVKSGRGLSDLRLGLSDLRLRHYCQHEIASPRSPFVLAANFEQKCTVVACMACPEVEYWLDTASEYCIPVHVWTYCGGIRDRLTFRPTDFHGRKFDGEVLPSNTQTSLFEFHKLSVNVQESVDSH